ncbi:MAG: hypothetical protein Fur0010_02210 [Bdellovibrio sp.]
MFQGLIIYDFAPDALIDQNDHADHFVLKTCQRVLVIGYKEIAFDLSLRPRQKLISTEAYTFLLETLCGLKSRLLGESEIVCQFKDHYNYYRQQDYSNSIVCTTLEKSFQDAKKIRTQFLKNIGMQSYAGLSRLLLHAFQQKEILIIGSGRLAKDLVKVLNKHHPLVICARNAEKARQLEQKTIEWNELENCSSYPIIVNTVGADEILFDQEFFDRWSKHLETERLFIDLGSPSVLRTTYMREQKVFKLSDLFELGEALDLSKDRKIKAAKEACQTEAIRRLSQHSWNFPYGWDDLQLFA